MLREINKPVYKTTYRARLARFFLSPNFQFGALVGGLIVFTINAADYTRDHSEPGSKFCFDCYWETGFPFTFYQYGSFAHLDRFVYSGLAGNILVGIMLALLFGFSFEIISRRLYPKTK